jgi:hypothetical protein
MTTTAVIKHFDVFKQVRDGLRCVRYLVPCTRSFFRLLKKLSVGALSQQLPLRLIEQRMPYEFSLRWKSWLAYWADSTGRRNISRLEVLNGTTTGMGSEQTEGPSCDHLADRVSINSIRSEHSGSALHKVWRPRPQRWRVTYRNRWGRGGFVKRAAWHRSTWRHTLGVICHFGREEIALLWAQDCSVREISRRLERSPSTISRELRRNAATRGGTLVYRATVAQWKAERAAERPKASKLAENDQLRTYVQDRLAGTVTDFRGKPIPGPNVPWKGRRQGRRADRRWGTCWSPEQISRRIQIDYPDDRSMRISHEAIYQALYIQGRGALRRELTACLRSGRALRVPRARTQQRGKHFVTRRL